ncbi:MAG TPA: c-type cytochrome [Sandaracinaceae bacterium LLY-WYZ-13_1]|nr:c-type cytochrome [Sandaracinaceae bacterium LLY-WYZ-13_1]
MTGRTKRRLVYGGAAALGLAALAFGVSASGLVPIGASSEHWPATRWFLGFSMHRSVATHSLGIDPPPLDDPAQLRLGAGHYETGCRMCHGAPGTVMPPVPRAMTPHPPRLPSRTSSMDDAGLYYVVRHGVKFTGMPAWPAVPREDEPWAVVAFLREMERMEPARYRALTRAPTEDAASRDAPPIVRETCARCHGTDGRGRDGTAPVLAGQRRAYLRASLVAYAQGDRHSGFMQPVAARMRRAEMRAVAAWYAGRPGLSEEVAPGEGRGAEIARRGIPSERIPACAPCHGPSAHRRNDDFPLLAGQDARWIENQLAAFVQGTRGGTEWLELMEPVTAHDLEPEARAAVAAYYAGAEDR